MVFLQGLQNMETSLGLTQISRENVNVLSMNQQFKNVLSYHLWKEGAFFFKYGIFSVHSCVQVHVYMSVCMYVEARGQLWMSFINCSTSFLFICVQYVHVYAC